MNKLYFSIFKKLQEHIYYPYHVPIHFKNQFPVSIGQRKEELVQQFTVVELAFESLIMHNKILFYVVFIILLVMPSTVALGSISMVALVTGSNKGIGFEIAKKI